jgi:hypothetical protein
MDLKLRNFPLLMAHGGAAMLTLMLLGALFPLHIFRAWRAKKNRLTGIIMIACNAMLIATAFGLYYLASETLRPWARGFRGTFVLRDGSLGPSSA